MSREIFELKHIFGLKLKEIRQEKGITYQELSRQTGMSVSYLSEIENGKKYPKGDKILLLAKALGVSYDHLVSLKVPKKLQPVIDLIQSDFFKAFPLEEFGINPQKIIEIISHDPEKITAFINTVLQISRNYELKKENFYHAALRSYQELNDNYFHDLEDMVEEFQLEYFELKKIPLSAQKLSLILLDMGVRVVFDELKEILPLKDLRSLYDPRARKLHINTGLNSGQVNFLLGREIAFQWLKIKKRPLSTPPHENVDFEEILNNYRASYFSAALMMPRVEVVQDIRKFASLDQWKPEVLLDFLTKYDVTPEMIMQRLTNILPKYFKLKNLFFLRFLGVGYNNFTLTKELHLTRLHNPHANELNEHYCRRWIALGNIRTLLDESSLGTAIRAGIQISQYYNSPNEYLCLSIAFPNISNRKESISVTIGFLVDRSLKKAVRFLDDPAIPRVVVNTTCERCAITDCKVRACEPVIYNDQIREREILKGIDKILSAHPATKTPA